MALERLCYLISRKNILNRARRRYHRRHRKLRLATENMSLISFYVAMEEQAKRDGKELMKEIKKLKGGLGYYINWDSSGYAYRLCENFRSTWPSCKKQAVYEKREIDKIAQDYLFYRALEEELAGDKAC